MSKITVLDCTLRDGGYYNEWNFSPNLVSAYLQAVAVARIDAVEIGFRFLPQNRFLGPFAYSIDDFLGGLPVPKGVSIAVMVNAKDLLEYKHGPAAAVDALFRESRQSPVDLVRVAVHFGELSECWHITEQLRKKGYRVTVNLMQASTRSADELTEAGRAVRSWNTVDILYLADSLGNMDPPMIRRAVDALNRGWSGPIGVHAHNNKGQALGNSLAAMEAGATWIDGTMLGMGRGAGNTQTEYLLLELQQRGFASYYPEGLFPLVIESFEGLRRQYGWGPNLLYYLSGSYGIHPTYVQEMLGNGRYDTHQVIAALELLKKSSPGAYSSGNLEEVILGTDHSGEGTWSATEWAAGKTVMIIGPGPGARDHIEALCRFIDRTAPGVVCLNASTPFPDDRVTAYAACHRTRLLMDAGKYRSLRKPLIAPLQAVPDMVKARFEGIHVLDYGMEVRADTFAPRSTSCVIPASLVAPYVMALAEAGGASRILLAGFDGYGPSDYRQLTMERVFHCYQSRPEAVPLLAVTPSTYEVPRGSIYSPVL